MSDPNCIKQVLLTNFFADFGGGEFALLDHARWLLARGVEVHVWLFTEGPFASKLIEEGCRVQFVRHRLDCGPRGFYLTALRLIPKLMWYMRRVRPDYVVVYTSHEMPFVVRAARLCRIPVMWRDQSRPPADDGLSDWRTKQLVSLSKHALSGVVCTTHARAEYLVEIGVPQKKVRSIYLGVDAGRFDNTSTERQAVQEDFGIPSGALIIGLFGRLIELKGQNILLDAVARLNTHDVHVLIVGGTQLNKIDGPEYVESLRSKASLLGIAERVHFTGFRDDIPRLMSACDVVCNASWWETFGLVLVEAMLSGKPVITSDVSGPREIVIHGETGYLFEVGDFSAMAQYLDKLLDDEDMRVRMGENGRKRASEIFDMNTNLQLLDDTIKGFLRESR